MNHKRTPAELIAIVRMIIAWVSDGDNLANLKRDAERYRWLRGLPDGFSIRMNIGHDWEMLAEEDLDMAIDYAMDTGATQTCASDVVGENPKR